MEGKNHKGGQKSLKESVVRVPFIVNWPGTIPNGITEDDMIDFTDVLPTFAELAQVEDLTGKNIDGQSFLPQLKGEKGIPVIGLFVSYPMIGLFELKNGDYEKMVN